MNNLRQSIRFLTWHLGHTLPLVLRHSSTYPELPRKSFARRLLENLYIYLRDGAPCAAYDGLGLDIKGRHLNDFVSNHLWTRFLNRRLTPEGWSSATALRQLVMRGKSQIPILQNKFLFWCFLSSQGIPVVPILAHTSNGELREHPSPGVLAAQKVFFVKPIGEMCGIEAHLLQVRDGRFLEGEREIPLSFFLENDRDFIFQPLIENHPDIRILNPNTLNTMRVVTCRSDKGELSLWDPGMLRIGRVDSNVDNFAKGGVGVGIDENGHLESHGFSHDKELNYTRMDRHPDSGISFAGRPIPFYAESVKLVMNAHRLFPTLETIGWDVAITKDGPLLLEGNHCWDIEMLQVVHHKGSAHRFREVFKQNP